MDTHHHPWQDKADSVRQRHRLNPKDVFISEVKFCFEVQVMNGSFWPNPAVRLCASIPLVLVETIN
jgi:hypothetical protein